MNRRYRLYIIAFAIYTSALLVTALLAWLAIQYDVVAGVAQLAVSVTGNGLGGVALVFGILQDDRAKKAEEETARARRQAEKSEQEAIKARQQADQFQKLSEQLHLQAEQQRQQAEEQRQRAERAEAELQRVRAQRDSEFADRLRRLEAAAGIAPPDTSDNATEN